MGLKFDGFGQTVLEFAKEIAANSGSAWTMPSHLLAALSRTPDAPGAKILHSMGLNQTELESFIEETVRPSGHPDPIPSPVEDPSLQKVLALAHVSATRRGAPEIGTEDMLLGLARTERFPTAQMLHRCGATPERIEGAIRVYETKAGATEAGQALVFLADRRGGLDLFALQLLTDIPIARLPGSVGEATTLLRGSLEAELLATAPGRSAPNALTEAIAHGWAHASSRRESFDRVHLLVAIAENPGSALSRVLTRFDWSPVELFRLLRP